MKRNDCSIVQDLLPLYIEDMLHPDTTAFVEDHLSDCEVCIAALAELKTETAAPDAEEKSKGDQQVLKQLKKTLTARSLTVCLCTFLYVTLLYSPLMGYAGIPWRAETISLFLSPVLFCVMFYVSRQKALSRNAVRFLICISVAAGCAPLYFLLSFFFRAIYITISSPNAYRPDSILEWLSAWMPTYGISIYLIPAAVFGLLLTVIAVRHIRAKYRQTVSTPPHAASPGPIPSQPTQTATSSTDAIPGSKSNQIVLAKKKPSSSNLAFLAAVGCILLHFFPWIIPQDITGEGGSGTLYLIFTGLPIFTAAVMAGQQKMLSRNMSLLYTGVIIPAVWVPLYLLIATLYQETLRFLAGKYQNVPPAFQHDTLWSLLSAVLRPAFLLTILCSILLVAISLHNLWRKTMPALTKPTGFQKIIGFFVIILTVCIVCLHLIPLVPTSKGTSSPAFSALFYGGLPLYISAASAFCKVRNKAGAIFASALALALPLYAALPVLSQLFPAVFSYFTWMTPDEYAPLYCIPFLILSCLLSATALCSVWYKWKQQTKA